MMRRIRDTTRALPRRALMRGVTAGSIAAYLGGAASGPAKAAEEAPFPVHPRWKFVFVNHVTSNPFFVPCQYGIQDACALLGVDYQWTGSETSDVAQMVNAFNAAIAGKPDAIAVCLVDPKGFDRPVENALAAGIPVFSYNADSHTNKRLAYIGQDLFLSGQMMGERIVKLVGSGKVAIFIATPGQLNLQPRVDGAMDSIKKSGANIQATMIATDPAANAGLTKIQAYYLGNQDVKGMFGVSGGDTMNCGLICRQYNLPSKGVHAGGYDLLPKSLEAVRDGFLDRLSKREAARLDPNLFKTSGFLANYGSKPIISGVLATTINRGYCGRDTRLNCGAAPLRVVIGCGKNHAETRPQETPLHPERPTRGTRNEGPFVLSL